MFSTYIHDVSDVGVWGLREKRLKYNKNVKIMSRYPFYEMQKNAKKMSRRTTILGRCKKMPRD